MLMVVARLPTLPSALRGPPPRLLFVNRRDLPRLDPSSKRELLLFIDGELESVRDETDEEDECGDRVAEW